MATERWVVVVVVAVVVGDWDDCASVGGGSGARVHRRARREDTLHYALSFWRQAGRDDDSKRVGRRGSLVESKEREELDEDEPGYAAFLKSDGYEENFSRG